MIHVASNIFSRKKQTILNDKVENEGPLIGQKTKLVATRLVPIVVLTVDSSFPAARQRLQGCPQKGTEAGPVVSFEGEKLQLVDPSSPPVHTSFFGWTRSRFVLWLLHPNQTLERHPYCLYTPSPPGLLGRQKSNRDSTLPHSAAGGLLVNP